MPSLNHPCFRQDDFPVNSFDVADGAHLLDEDLYRMTRSSKITTLHMPDTLLAFGESELHQTLQPLSTLASSSRAIDQDLSESNPNWIDYQRTVMFFQL